MLLKYCVVLRHHFHLLQEANLQWTNHGDAKTTYAKRGVQWLVRDYRLSFFWQCIEHWHDRFFEVQQPVLVVTTSESGGQILDERFFQKFFITFLL